MADKIPPWAEDLAPKGTYFEGVEDAQTIVTKHTNDTVTTFGTRISRKTTKVYKINTLIHIINSYHKQYHF